jgi:hypothetical protein
MMTATATLSLKTMSDLVSLNTAICNAMTRAAKVGNTEAMQSLLRDRRAVRTEIDRRRAAASN